MYGLLYIWNMPRLNREDWLHKGLEILSAFDQDKIKILYLCKQMGVTRGSFYHHFESIEDYIGALMGHWTEQNTQRFIQVASSEEGPEAQIKVLNALVLESDLSLEAAIRSWSYYNAQVKGYLEQVDRLRLAFLEKVFSAMGMEAQLAKGLASIEYALLVGVQQLYPQLSPEELGQLFMLHQQMRKTEV